jgi:polyisoprenoid-binding protein YceI
VKEENMTARLILFLLTYACWRSIAVENPPFPAGLREIEFDSAKCTVQITLGALLHTVHGTFKVKEATVRFDPTSGRASGRIEVDVRSGETGESARDQQMHDNVLESKRFQEAVFSPDRVKGRLAPSGESQVEVHGSLRIHGEEHEMTIPVRVNKENDQVTAKAKFVVPYVAWGMKDPSNLVLRVDKSVDVEVVLIGTVTVRSQTSEWTRPDSDRESASARLFTLCFRNILQGPLQLNETSFTRPLTLLESGSSAHRTVPADQS